MAAHKLDQLFKKKLDKHESEPSADAWANMEKMLSKRKKKAIWFYYKVAVAILLIMITGLITYQYQLGDTEPVVLTDAKKGALEASEKTRLAADNSLVEEDFLKNEAKRVRKEKTQIISPSKKLSTQKDILLVANNKLNVEENIIFQNLLEDRSIADELITLNDTSIYVIPSTVMQKNSETEISPKNKRQPIRIIYKRGNKKQSRALVAQNDTLKRKKVNFNSIIDATKNIAPGDLLADIRDAKDNFFSKKLDFNKAEKVKNKNSNK